MDSNHWIEGRAEYLRGNRLRQVELGLAILALAVSLLAWISQDLALTWVALGLLLVGFAIHGADRLKARS